MKKVQKLVFPLCSENLIIDFTLNCGKNIFCIVLEKSEKGKASKLQS
jgi:hypothetical protein